MSKAYNDFIKELLKCPHCGKMHCDCLDVISQCEFCPVEKTEACNSCAHNKKGEI